MQDDSFDGGVAGEIAGAAHRVLGLGCRADAVQDDSFDGGVAGAIAGTGFWV